MPTTAINIGGSLQVSGAEAWSCPTPFSSAGAMWAEQGQTTKVGEVLSWVGRNYSQPGSAEGNVY